MNLEVRVVFPRFLLSALCEGRLQLMSLFLCSAIIHLLTIKLAIDIRKFLRKTFLFRGILYVNFRCGRSFLLWMRVRVCPPSSIFIGYWRFPTVRCLLRLPHYSGTCYTASPFHFADLYAPSRTSSSCPSLSRWERRGQGVRTARPLYGASMVSQRNLSFWWVAHPIMIRLFFYKSASIEIRIPF